MITLDIVAQIPLFSHMAEGLQIQIANRAADVRLQAGEWLIQEGELPLFFVLVAGSLDVIKHLGNVEQVIGTYGPGDYFGELPLLLNSTVVVSLKTREPSRILRLDPDDFHTLLLGDQKINHDLLKTMAQRIQHLQQLAVESAAHPVRIIGYRWDPQCHELRDFLARNHVGFEWLNPTDAEAQQYFEQAETKDVCPLVILHTGTILITPSLREVAQQIGLQTVPTAAHYDVAILGAGPAGLAAAVYGASEGLKTLLIDREAPGGQAGTSSRIENYLGFPTGISGEELSHRAWQQAQRFGAEILVSRCVQKIHLAPGAATLVLDDNERVSARAIVIATGVSWRRLTVEGIDQLVGRGVYYGAARTEAIGTRGKKVYLVGGGNSAGQAAMFFSNYADSVTLLIRGETLEATMSHYLIEQLGLKSNIQVLTNREIAAVQGKDHLEAIVIKDRRTQTEETHTTDALFIFIGANAQTEWLPQEIACDDQGYILTGSDVITDQRGKDYWPLTRAPFLLETSVPGIFAAGDVRHNSIKRVASGVGEGSMSIAFIHQYLAS